MEWGISPGGVSAEGHWKLYTGQGLEEYPAKEDQPKDGKDCRRATEKHVRCLLCGGGWCRPGGLRNSGIARGLGWDSPSYRHLEQDICQS